MPHRYIEMTATKEDEKQSEIHIGKTISSFADRGHFKLQNKCVFWHEISSRITSIKWNYIFFVVFFVPCHRLIAIERFRSRTSTFLYIFFFSLSFLRLCHWSFLVDHNFSVTFPIFMNHDINHLSSWISQNVCISTFTLTTNFWRNSSEKWHNSTLSHIDEKVTEVTIVNFFSVSSHVVVTDARVVIDETDNQGKCILRKKINEKTY